MENEKNPTQQENKCHPNMPAFASEHSFGLTKKEYFAAMAMQSFISAEMKNHEKILSLDEDNFENIALNSVIMAEALIDILNEKYLHL